MTDTITDPFELVLQIELESIQDEIRAVQQRLQGLETEQREAEDAEGEALSHASAMHAYADPLVLATRIEESRYGIIVGDTYFRTNHPAAAAALGQAQAADVAVQRASAHVIKLAALRDDYLYRLLPHLNAALDTKQKELEAHRQTQQQARAMSIDRSWQAEFIRKLRGEA